MISYSLKVSLFGIAVATSLCSTGASAYTSSSVIKWNEGLLQAIRMTRPGPPMTARAVGEVNTCMFDAWAAYDQKAVGTMLGDRLRRPDNERTEANKRIAVSYAGYRALVDLFPARKADFDTLMVQQGLDPNDSTMDQTTPAGIGNTACKAVLDMRHHDGANQLGDLAPGAYADYTGYIPVNTPSQINDPNHWEPLIVGGKQQPFVGAQWYKVTPFALKRADQFRPKKGPAMYGSHEYIEQAKVVIDYSAHLTDEQKVIAEYWADGPNSEFPPGHWILFGIGISERDNHNIDDDARMFFALGNAMHDAAIVSWEAKRAYDYVRPLTAIHYLFADKTITAWGGPGQGTKQILGSQWQTYQATSFNTPPFPEWFSGHSTFSAAGAEILRSFTKSDIFGGSYTAPAGSSRVEPWLVPANPVTLSWATFSDAANQAGISRRYGGIHFVQGDMDGRAAGKEVGKLVWRKANGYINGNRFED